MQTPYPQGNPQNRPQGNPQTKSNPGFKFFMLGLKFCILVSIGCIILLNFQPWREVAGNIGSDIAWGKSVPFQKAVESIPFIGGWVEWIGRFLALCGAVDVIALGLWGLVNGLESLPWFFETKLGDKIPAKTKKIISTARWFAYVVEGIVCWVRYPCYKGGFQAIMDDAPNFDPSLIDYSAMLNFVIALLAFEGLLILYKKISELGYFSKSVKT